MRNPQVQSALAAFLVDQIYQNVDVKADLQKQLPKNLKGLAGPAAAALNDYGTRAATRLLATDAVINLVQAATRLAHSEFLRIVDDKPGAGQKVYLQLRPVVLKLAGRLGLEDQVAAKLPPDAGQFVVLDDTNVTISTVRQSVKLVRALSLFLLLVVVASVRGRDLVGARLAARGDPALRRRGADRGAAPVRDPPRPTGRAARRPRRPAPGAAGRERRLPDPDRAAHGHRLDGSRRRHDHRGARLPRRPEPVRARVPHLRSARSRAAPLDRLGRRRTGDPADPDRRTDH